jgi:predicted metal-binding protein
MQILVVTQTDPVLPRMSQEAGEALERTSIIQIFQQRFDLFGDGDRYDNAVCNAACRMAEICDSITVSRPACTGYLLSSILAGERI